MLEVTLKQLLWSVLLSSCQMINMKPVYGHEKVEDLELGDISRLGVQFSAEKTLQGGMRKWATKGDITEVREEKRQCVKVGAIQLWFIVIHVQSKFKS